MCCCSCSHLIEIIIELFEFALLFFSLPRNYCAYKSNVAGSGSEQRKILIEVGSIVTNYEKL